MGPFLFALKINIKIAKKVCYNNNTTKGVKYG